MIDTYDKSNNSVKWLLNFVDNQLVGWYSINYIELFAYISHIFNLKCDAIKSKGSTERDFYFCFGLEMKFREKKMIENKVK